MRCFVTIDGKEFSFEVDGDFFWGKDEILYNPTNNAISNTSWEKDGFNIIELLNHEEQNNLNTAMTQVICNLLNEFDLEANPSQFNLERYHQYVTDDIHQKIIRKTRFLTFKDLNLDIHSITRRLTNILGTKISGSNPLLDNEIVILRVSRPHQLDINPPHRDGYLDVWEDTLNLWLPIIGCDKNSSLPVIPGSHYWNEKNIFRTSNKGASINKLNYHVPAILETKHGLNMIRPNPNYGQALIFTPFLIHGCATNFNEDITRFSLELRLFHQSSSEKRSHG